MRRFILSITVMATLLAAAQARAGSVRTFQYLVTGNSFGFQIYDASKKKIVQFLERPYRALKPRPGQPKSEGIIRRNLAYDVYFGLRAGSSASWLNSTDSGVSYYQESNVIRTTGKVGNVETESYYFAPYGYKGNAMVMLIKATNKGSAAVKVDAFSLFNFHMGGKEGDENPAANNETVTHDKTNKVATEVGPGGGMMIYVPIGGADRVTCSSSAWSAVKNGQDVPVQATCANASDAVNIMQKGLGSLGAGKSAWWGAAILFESSTGDKAKAIARWKTFSGGKTADKLLLQVMDEWKKWRKPIPSGVVKSAKELAIWRQSEVVLRMGQILEPWSASPKLKNHGMMLASLPPGGWHIGWVRDGIFAVVAMARTGHHEEARKGLEFFLNAEANKYKIYTENKDYRISLTRYFGNGVEEIDYSGQPTPNVEFDGWGMWLWGARVYMDLSGNKTWMSGKTKYNEVIWDVVKKYVADPLEAMLDKQYWIVKPDTSIWEVHWDKRQHFFWTTAAAARGFCDLAAMAERHGKTTEAKKYADLSAKIVKGIRNNFIDSKNVLAGSTEQLAKGKNYRDGATVEAITWDIFKPTDPISIATLKDFSYLKTKLGGYKRIEGSNDPYDVNEWIMIDLRVADAFRRVGRTAEADALLKWVTEQGAANFNLLPELYDVYSTNGKYTGAIPMVGYGAGAYMMTLLERAGISEPRKCLGSVAPQKDMGVPAGDGPTQTVDLPYFPPEEGGVNPGADSGTGNNLEEATGFACLCETGAGAASGVPSADVIFAFLLCLGAVAWRRRKSNHRA